MIIRLDAGVKSTLKWEVPKDDNVIYHLDLGVEHLQKPLEDIPQCSALKLACDHFINTVYKGQKVILYRGKLPGGDPFVMRDRLNDYFDILTANWPKSVEMELQFIPEDGWNSIFTHQVFHKEAFPRFRVEFGRKQSRSKRAVLVPPFEVKGSPIVQGHYRILYESELLNECTGIDELICHLDALSDEGRRVVAGFQAAEGKVVNTDLSPYTPEC